MSILLANHLYMPINHMGYDREAYTISYYSTTTKHQILTYPVALVKQVLPMQASGWMFAKEQG